MKSNQISQEEHHQQLTAIHRKLPAYPSSLLITTPILLGCSNLHFICQDHLIDLPSGSPGSSAASPLELSTIAGIAAGAAFFF